MTRPLARLAARSRELKARIHHWLDRRARQAALTELDDDRLRDIGLTPEEISRVRARPF